jgi:hypothetical protein
MDLARFFIGSIEEGGEKLTYREAVQDPRWVMVMEEEFFSVMKNHTWSLIILLPGICPITMCWIFKIKPESNSQHARYKACIVAHGFQ